jgi:hypothetical protein
MVNIRRTHKIIKVIETNGDIGLYLKEKEDNGRILNIQPIKVIPAKRIRIYSSDSFLLMN